MWVTPSDAHKAAHWELPGKLLLQLLVLDVGHAW